MANNTIFKLSNRTALLPQFTSLYSTKVSRVSFTSTSKYLNQHSREDAGGEEDAAKVAARIREARQVYEKEKDNEDEDAEEIKREYHEMKDKAKDTAHDVKEKVKETAKGAWENAKDASKNVKDTFVGKD